MYGLYMNDPYVGLKYGRKERHEVRRNKEVNKCARCVAILECAIRLV
jgi:hypothetical protein